MVFNFCSKKEVKDMKHLIHVYLILIIVNGFPSCKNASYLERRDGLTIVHLEGTPFERGAAYGQLLKEEIHETIMAWKEEVESTFHCDFHTVIGEFFDSTNYRECIEAFDPDLLDEVYGMSESCRIDFLSLMAFQMSEELFISLDQNARSKCTSIGSGLSDSTSSLLAQNMDPPHFLHLHPLVMHIIPENGAPESYVFSVAGLFGLAGMNQKGVAVTCMGLSMLNHSRAGLPVISVLRNLLSRSSLEEAEEFIKQSSFAIPQCYAIGGPDGLRCFECSAGQIAEFYPFEDCNVVLHTNFSIRNRDFNQQFIDLLESYGKTVDDLYLCPRYYLAYDKIEALHKDLDVESIAGILRFEGPEIEPILNQNTLGTLVMELDDDPTLYLALGCRQDEVFHKLSFR
jgi:Acyl-coenzyme A:6-aminopenicillanic acid acyl-transferase